MEQRKNIFLSATNVESLLTHIGQMLSKLSRTHVQNRNQREIRPRLPDHMQCCHGAVFLDNPNDSSGQRGGGGGGGVVVLPKIRNDSTRLWLLILDIPNR